MAFGTITGVIDICHNTDVELIDRMLVKARARLVTRVNTEAKLAKLTVVIPETDVDLDTVVEAIAAGLVGLGPGNVNPRTGFTVDGFSRKDGDKSQLQEWQDIADDGIADFIATNGTSNRSWPVMKVVSRDGVRIGEYTETD